MLVVAQLVERDELRDPLQDLGRGRSVQDGAGLA